MRVLTCVKHLPPCKNFILTLSTWLYWILICFNHRNKKVEKSIGQCSLNPHSWTKGSVIGNQEEWSPRENRRVGAETQRALSHSQAVLASSLVCFMHFNLMFWCGIQGPPLTLLSLSDQTICIPVPPLDSSSHQLKKIFYSWVFCSCLLCSPSYLPSLLLPSPVLTCASTALDWFYSVNAHSLPPS